jgi:hypothetical protein
MLQLSAWNIMHKDLIPLILTYSQNQKLVYLAVKLIAFLTLPSEKSATNLQEQNRAHRNDVNALIENEHIFAIVFGLIIEPLQKLESGANFKEGESKSLQLILTFYRNLLIIAEEGNNARVKKTLTSCLLKYDFLDVLLVLVQNHKKILSHEDTALTIEILQLLFRGTPLQVIEEFDCAEDIRKEDDSSTHLNIVSNLKFRSHRFKGKFEQVNMLHHSKLARSTGTTQYNQRGTHKESSYLLDDSASRFWSILLKSTHFGAFVYHAWRDIVRTSGDLEQRATEWQTRCYNLLQFSTCGLQVFSKSLLHSSESNRQTSIQAVADIFESSFIHWLRMEWIALEHKNDYYGANLICGTIVEILSVLQRTSAQGTRVEKDVSNFLIRELFFKTKSESILEQACSSLIKMKKNRLPQKYLFSLICILNTSMKILKTQQSYHTSEKLQDNWNIYDDKIIHQHVQILKGEVQTEEVLDSIRNYLQTLVNAGHLEKLFTFRHLVCLYGFTISSTKNYPSYRACSTTDLKKICRFVLNCFLASIVKRDQNCDRQKFLVQILAS